jgi:hypothetical protein
VPKGISINIGLNGVDADAYGGWDGALVACEFDANDMAAIARDKGFETTVLLTADAKSDAILGAVSDAAGSLGDGDVLLVTYSGHGGQVPDSNSDEDDRQDETWVAYDRQIVDDELYAAWGKFANGVRIVVLSDSCHSGSVARAVAAAIRPEAFGATVSREGDANSLSKAMPADVQDRNYSDHQAEYDAIQKDNPAFDAAEIPASVLLISGCQDNQTSSDGDRNGLFTQTLLKVWNDGKFKGGYRTFAKQIVAEMPPWQTPNFFTAGTPNRRLERQHPFTV